MKNIINKLYEFIAKLVLMLENELDIVATGKSENAIKAKKNITEILNRLVNVITQLNRLDKDLSFNDDDSFLTSQDKEIIERFIAQYKDNL